MTEATPGVSGRLVLLAGATSAAGEATARALVSAGARVIAVARSADRLASLAGATGAETQVCDLTSTDAVAALAERVHVEHGSIDGLIPLVGGWRGGGGLAGQSDEDYRFLEAAFTTLRLTSRQFDADLRASAAGRLAIVSSTAVARPLAGGANYAAMKAASEAWARAVAHGFAKDAREAGEPLRAASVVFRAKALGPDVLADAVVGLWESDAADLNERIIDL